MRKDVRGPAPLAKDCAQPAPSPGPRGRCAVGVCPGLRGPRPPADLPLPSKRGPRVPFVRRRRGPGDRADAPGLPALAARPDTEKQSGRRESAKGAGLN